MEKRNSKLYIGLALLMTAILAITVITLVSSIARRGLDPALETGEGSGSSAQTDTPQSAVPGTKGPVMLLPDEATEDAGKIKTDPSPETEEGTEPEGTAPLETEPTALQTGAPLTFVQPVAGHVVKFHDPDMPVYSFTMNDWRVHKGVDISATLGSEVKACAAGVIESVGNDPMMGETVIIDHGDGLKSYYKNLSVEHPADIVPGAIVRAGQCIGGIGESSLIEVSDVSHLHFEMKLGGIDVDPLLYLPYDVVTEE